VRRSLGPLLCELHAHSRWSDGSLSIPELVDAHGRSGFDVLCVTDHVVRSDDPWRERDPYALGSVDEEAWEIYLAQIEHEAVRAWRTYGMLVLPGLELTYNDEDPDAAAHAIAVGLREFVSVDDGMDEALRSASTAGAALVAAHPNGTEPATSATRLTRRFFADARSRAHVHRFELFNRTQLFGWVATAGLPAVACGDFHVPEHLRGWKTLLPSAHDEEAVVGYLRSARPVYLVRLDAQPAHIAA
jgi:predicted metal-dependent phosphoesterase TrpH